MTDKKWTIDPKIMKTLKTFDRNDPEHKEWLDHEMERIKLSLEAEKQGKDSFTMRYRFGINPQKDKP